MHGYEAEVVFLIDPGKEGLVLVVEDSTSSIPAIVAASITKHTASKVTLPLSKLLQPQAQLISSAHLPTFKSISESFNLNNMDPHQTAPFGEV